MAVSELPGMTADEIVELSRKYTLYEWSAQSAVDPIPVDRAQGWRGKGMMGSEGKHWRYVAVSPIGAFICGKAHGGPRR